MDCTIDTRGPLDGLSVASSVRESVSVSARSGVATIRFAESVTNLVVSEPNSQTAEASYAKTRDGEVS